MSFLDKATKYMNNFIDYKHRPAHYKVGDMILINFNSRQFMALSIMFKNLVQKYEGSLVSWQWWIRSHISKELSPHFKVHHIFHANTLKTYHKDKDDFSLGQSSRASIIITALHD